MLISNFFTVVALVFLNASAMDSSAERQQSQGKILSAQEEWIPLFDGKTLNGWKVSENPATFAVEDGAIVVHGPRAHLFYDGEVNDHDFKNFELKVDVMTFPGANSGIYFHTQFQEKGFPSVGHEVQVNVSHSDWRRSGSIYGVVNIDAVPIEDNVWYEQHIIVNGNTVRILIDGKLIFEYTEPKTGIEPRSGRAISRGTFALQGHDPESKVLFRNINVKILPD